MTLGDGSPSQAWRSALSRATGRSHRLTQTPCQDQVFRREHPDGVLVLALADGAGSAYFSHYGAEAVNRSAAAWLNKNFDRLFRATNNTAEVKEELSVYLQRVLSELARRGIPVDNRDRSRLRLPRKSEQPRIRCSPRDLASTLLVVAMKDQRYLALHLGDGVIGAETLSPRGRRRMTVLSAPEEGEHANETFFVGMPNAGEHLRLYRGQVKTARQEISGFILMSDGPQAVLYQKKTDSLAPACSKLIAACRGLPPSQAQKQLSSTLERLIIPRTHDDCSLVLLSR